jgi:hypothetical protein
VVAGNGFPPVQRRELEHVSGLPAREQTEQVAQVLDGLDAVAGSWRSARRKWRWRGRRRRSRRRASSCGYAEHSITAIMSSPGLCGAAHVRSRCCRCDTPHNQRHRRNSTRLTLAPWLPHRLRHAVECALLLRLEIGIEVLVRRLDVLFARPMAITERSTPDWCYQPRCLRENEAIPIQHSEGLAFSGDPNRLESLAPSPSRIPRVSLPTMASASETLPLKSVRLDYANPLPAA